MDSDKYNWKASRPDDPSYYSRLTYAGQAFMEILRRFSSGEQNLLIGCQVTFTKPISTADVLARTRETWEALRFDVPIIAAQTEFDADWNTTMTYRLAKSSKEVAEWAKRTVRLGEGANDLNELRYELSKKEIPEENGDQTFLYVLPTGNSSYGFLLHTHHTPFDGTGVQVLMNQLIDRLVKSIENPVLSLAFSDRLAWGTESKNLSPPSCAVVGPTEATEGPLYEQGMQMILSSYGTLSRGIGFKRRNVGPGPTRRMHLSFSEEDTTKFVRAVRALGFTVNEFAHAALCVLCYLDNPPTETTPPDAAYVCFGLRDCRDRLLPQYEKLIGHCLGVHGIPVPASVIAFAASKGEKAQIIEAAKVVKAEYKIMKSNPTLISAQPVAGQVVFQAAKAAGPSKPNFGFWFAGDGFSEKHINRAFEGADGRIVATIDEEFTSLNMTNPGPFFRLYTWRGKLRLSMDANEYAMPNDVSQGFVEKWASLLRLAS